MKKENAMVKNKQMGESYFSPLISPFSFSRGFTLIELLAVIGIVLFLGGILVTLVTITFRGSKKSDALIHLRQNGNAAISQMSRSIRYAKTITAPASCVPSTQSSSLTIVSAFDGGFTTYSCVDGISSNSASLIDSNAIQVSGCSFICTQRSLQDSPTVTMQFTLQPKSTNTLIENNATIPFRTSVTLRNYAP